MTLGPYASGMEPNSQPQSLAFPLDLRLAAGQCLRLTAATRGWVLRANDNALVASIQTTPAPTITCPDDSWRLIKRKRFGWSAALERCSDGAHLGTYRPHLSRAGGTLSLPSFGAATLTKQLGRQTWVLRAADRRSNLATIRAGRPVIEISVSEASARVPALHLLLLTTCAIILLDQESRLTATGGVDLLPGGTV
jgi:hypothetical protein